MFETFASPGYLTDLRLPQPAPTLGLPPGVITVMFCDRPKQATKTMVWSPSLGWGENKLPAWERPMWFSKPLDLEVGNVDELAAAVELTRGDPRAFLIRGSMKTEEWAAFDADPGHRTRRLKDVSKDGHKPTIDDCENSWIVVDNDKFVVEHWGAFLSNPELVISDYVRLCLPKCFHNVRAYWQLSAKAGLEGRYLRAHLFFYLKKPITSEDLMLVMHQQIGKLTLADEHDFSAYSANQPIYVQNPILHGGADPIARRTGWLEGAGAAVTLPALEVEPEREWNLRKRVGVARAATVLEPSRGDPWTQIGDGPGLDGFHRPLLRATSRCAAAVVRGDAVRDDAAIKTRLRAAVAIAPRSGGAARDCAAVDYIAEHSLDDYITSGFRKAQARARSVETVEPLYALPTTTLGDAEMHALTEMTRFVDTAVTFVRRRAKGLDAILPRFAAKWVTGLGKSHIIQSLLPSFIARVSAIFADADPGERRDLVQYLVPEHALGREAKARMEALGLKVATLRGRAQIDPDGDGRHMCRNLESVRIAEAAGWDSATAVCGKPGGICCPFRDSCAYIQQQARLGEVDVVIAAHNLAFQQPHPVVAKRLAMTVLDESFTPAAMYDAPAKLKLSTFAKVGMDYPVLMKHAGQQVRDDVGTQELHDISVRLERALSKTPDGDFIRADSLIDAGLTRDLCEMAVKLEWRRKVECAMQPGVPVEAAAEAARAGAGNRGIGARAALWRALAGLVDDATNEDPEDHADDVCGSARVVSERGEAIERYVLIYGRREFNSMVAAHPLSALDATMNMSILDSFLGQKPADPSVRLNYSSSEVDARAPNMHLIQITGAWGKIALGAVMGEDGSPVPQPDKARLYRDLRTFVALRAKGNALVICYQAIEHVFANLPGVRVAHHGAIAGLDQYKDVQALFSIGRPLARPEVTRDMALALFGEPIELESGTVFRPGALMRDGSGVAMSLHSYNNHRMEAVRSSVTDAAVIQAIGRGRGVRRTEGDPLDVYVLSDVLLPMPADRISTWAEVAPNAAEHMMVRGRALLSRVDAFRAYPGGEADDPHAPGLFRSEKDARLALEMIPPEWRPPPGWVRVRYQPAGNGQKSRVGIFRADALDAARAWLGALLGAELVRFEREMPHVEETAARPPEARAPASPLRLIIRGASAPPQRLTGWRAPGGSVLRIKHMVYLPQGIEERRAP